MEWKVHAAKLYPSVVSGVLAYMVLLLLHFILEAHAMVYMGRSEDILHLIHGS